MESRFKAVIEVHKAAADKLIAALRRREEEKGKIEPTYGCFPLHFLSAGPDLGGGEEMEPGA